MMTVVMIGHKGIPSHGGGIERHVEELSAALVVRGIRVISFDRKWYAGSSAPVPGVDRRWSFGIRSKHFDAITNTLTAIVLARRDHPDIIHIHGVGPALMAPIARLLHPKAKVVITFHCEDWKHVKWGAFARAMLRLGESFACLFAHRTITVSNELASRCLRAYECQTDMIPNGVRVKPGAPIDPLARWNISPNAYFALIARLVPHKNVHVAVEAHKALAERDPELAAAHPLVVVGGPAFTDEYLSELKAFIGSYPHVVLTGEQTDDTLRALQEHAIGHLSVSSSEGMSIGLLEAMALAKPVIVSDIPENLEVTDADALVVKTNDVSSLSHAMEYLLRMTEEERETMGATLAARAKACHDWDAIAEETLRVYFETLGVPVRSIASV